MTDTPIPQNNGYGKKPLWQWAIIYVVIGAIVYGLIYYFVFAKKGGYSYAPQTQYQNQTQQSANPTIPATQNTVTLTQNGFVPQTITIKAGQTIMWVNKSGSDATVNSNPHPIHTDYPPLNLGSFADGQSLSLRFPKSGTYGYHNHLNPSQGGTVIVK